MVKISLPPLSEQRRIVEILYQVDALRKRRAEADSKAEQILPAMFIDMFGDPATNPKRSEEVTLSDVAIEFRYGTSTKCFPEPNGLPVLRIPNILRGEIDLGNLKYAELSKAEVDRLLLQRGDLLFAQGSFHSISGSRLSAEEHEDHLKTLLTVLDEKQRRLYLGFESLKLGHGGDVRIASIAGVNVKTVARGRRELLSK